MATQNISVRLDISLLNRIDDFAKSRNITRSKAIAIMLRSTQIIVLTEGSELVKVLFNIERLLQSNSYKSEIKLEKEREKLWQLLNSITKKIQ